MEVLQAPINVIINPAHTKEAVLKAIEQNYIELAVCLDNSEATASNASNASNIITTLETLDHRLAQTCALLQYLLRVLPTVEVVEAYSNVAEDIGTYAYSIVQNVKLQEKISAALQKTLSSEEEAILQQYQTMLSLSGAYLPVEAQQQYATLQNKLNYATQIFEQNLLQKILIDGTELVLDEPTYKAMIIKEDSPDKRRQIYEAYYTKDSNEAILALINQRLNVARLLGYDNYLSMSLATNKSMSDMTEITKFLDKLSTITIAQCNRIIKEIKKCFNESTIYAWDIDYYLRKYSKFITGVAADEISVYYEIDQILAGLSTLTQKLFNITLTPISTEAKWHPDVKVFAVKHDDHLLGYLYADLFARPNKQGNAWVEAYQSRRKLANEHIQLPTVLLTCNFSQPKKDKPCLLTQDELIGLFHEFGHTLHHLLTESDYASLAGTNGVPLDEVEIPSMFFERFAWDKSFIDMIAAHYQTGQKMPRKIFLAIHYTRQFMAPFVLLHRLKLAYCDLALYSATHSLSLSEVQQRIQEVESKLNVMDNLVAIPWYNSVPLIFTSPYAAGYYGYLWSEMLAADLFAIFSKEGVITRTMGEALKKYLFAPSKPENIIQLVNTYCGRSPNPRALLTNYSIPGECYE